MRSLVPIIPTLPANNIRHLYEVVRLCVAEQPDVLDDPDWREAIEALQHRLAELGDDYPPIEARSG